MTLLWYVRWRHCKNSTISNSSDKYHLLHHAVVTTTFMVSDFFEPKISTSVVAPCVFTYYLYKAI